MRPFWGALAVLAVIVFGDAPVLAQASQQAGNAPPAIREEESPTNADGQVDERARAHSRKIPHTRTDRNLDAKTKTDGDVHLSTDYDFVQLPLRPMEEQLAEDVCKSDAVIVGVYGKRLRSHLTEERDWVLSEFDVRVVSVLKDNPQHQIVQGEHITLVEDGGTVILNNHKVIAESSLQLRRSTTYLLFLKYIPETDSYHFSAVPHSVAEGKLTSVISAKPYYNGLEVNRLSQLVAAAASIGCQASSGN